MGLQYLVIFKLSIRKIVIVNLMKLGGNYESNLCKTQ